MCHHVAYRELPLGEQDVSTPETAAEWTQLRRWAKRLVIKHTANLGRDNLYVDVMAYMPGLTIQYADSPDVQGRTWPHDALQEPQDDRQWCQFYCNTRAPSPLRNTLLGRYPTRRTRTAVSPSAKHIRRCSFCCPIEVTLAPCHTMCRPLVLEHSISQSPSHPSFLAVSTPSLASSSSDPKQ